MKLIPASNAAFTHASACSRATPPEYVSHEPRLISETSIPLEPSLRKFIAPELIRWTDRQPARKASSSSLEVDADGDPPDRSGPANRLRRARGERPVAQRGLLRAGARTARDLARTGQRAVRPRPRASAA